MSALIPSFIFIKRENLDVKIHPQPCPIKDFA
jgi:hypothetical protein